MIHVFNLITENVVELAFVLIFPKFVKLSIHGKFK